LIDRNFSKLNCLLVLFIYFISSSLFYTSRFYNKDARGVVMKIQRGVFRTNCMDNLDRTNVVQSLFARRAALLSIPGAWPATQSSGCSVLTSPFPEFEKSFNAVWADNADALSMLYSGTGALKTDFTRTGKRTMAGVLSDGMNSVKRYVLNNLWDGHTQDAWDLFLAKYIPRTDSSSGNTAVAPLPSAIALRMHRNTLTPMTFLTGGLLTFFGVAAGCAFASYIVIPRGVSTMTRFSWGTSAAFLLFGGLAYFLIARGLPLGRFLVSRPSFIPIGQDVTEVSEANGVEMTRVKTA
jgi:phosphatidylinositol 4-phosphatase